MVRTFPESEGPHHVPGEVAKRSQSPGARSVGIESEHSGHEEGCNGESAESEHASVERTFLHDPIVTHFKFAVYQADLKVRLKFASRPNLRIVAANSEAGQVPLWTVRRYAGPRSNQPKQRDEGEIQWTLAHRHDQPAARSWSDP